MRRGSLRRDVGSTTSEQEALEAELALLREENARLKVDAAKPPGAGRAIERLRSVAEAASASADVDRADDAWQALSEATMLREVLVDMCEQVQGAIGVVQSRLQNVAAGTAGDLASTPRHAALGPACEHCGAPLRFDRAEHVHATPVPLRAAQAVVGDGVVIAGWEGEHA